MGCLQALQNGPSDPPPENPSLRYMELPPRDSQLMASTSGARRYSLPLWPEPARELIRELPPFSALYRGRAPWNSSPIAQSPPCALALPSVEGAAQIFDDACLSRRRRSGALLVVGRARRLGRDRPGRARRSHASGVN